MQDLFHRLLILRTPGIGPVKYAELIKLFGSAAEAARSLACDDKLVDAVNRELDLANSLNITYICDDDLHYPENLRKVKNHSPVISVRGNIKTLGKKTVSIVGTRHATGAGLRFAGQIAQEFATNSYAVASGMAMGTDTAAHVGALGASGNSNTVAVLAGGVDYVWPLENESLYREILERGCVISEMPVGFKPVANNFMLRNKIVAGLAEKLILGEADLKSGSMATARFAIEYGREVWAIPGHPTDERSRGPNHLIRHGLAKLCDGVSDFFEISVPKKENCKNIKNNSELLDRLGSIPMTESVLSEIAKKSVAEIKSELTVLELQGLVQKTGNGYVKS